MDADQFDALTRVLSNAPTRRTAIGGALMGLLLPLTAEAKRKRPHGKDAKHDKGKHRNRKRHQGRTDRRAQAEAVCYGNTSCTPKPGANLGSCDFTGSGALKGAKCAGCNLGSAGLGNADLSGADLSRVNLGGACLVGASLRGAVLTGANASGALYCGTIMPDGTVNNRDCAKGTACCPTCDTTRPCGAGQVCCGNSCVAGTCCSNAQCTDPAKPICRNGACGACTASSQCGSGKICCGGQCQSGVCCSAADCADRLCQNTSCPDGTCAYTPVGNGTPCGENATCQNGECITTCTPATCQSLGKTCGTWPDGCGGQLTCGTCTPGTCQVATCTDGTCITSPISGAQGPGCTGSGQQCCSGTCKFTSSDLLNCGSCGNVCRLSGERCTNGTCACPTNYQRCPSECLQFCSNRPDFYQARFQDCFGPGGIRPGDCAYCTGWAGCYGALATGTTCGTVTGTCF